MLRQIYKAKRQLFARLYPTLYVYKDGSTVTIRHPEPRLIIREPLTLEECVGAEKTAWQNRRRLFLEDAVQKDSADVTFDARKYLRRRKTDTFK